MLLILTSIHYRNANKGIAQSHYEETSKFKNTLSLPSKHHEKDLGKNYGRSHVLKQNLGIKGKYVNDVHQY
ncbi:hypothetical protein NC651_018284 [Populus alba x Populus x berolinensis]|nr:hypothetical protein NC651_018284 [Populus alba x Populus x berolinensis]